MSILEKVKESKKLMLVKMDMANKIADEAATEFIDSVKSIVKDASNEDINEILESDDDIFEDLDKMVVITAFAESNDADGIVVVGVRK